MASISPCKNQPQKVVEKCHESKIRIRGYADTLLVWECLYRVKKETPKATTKRILIKVFGKKKPGVRVFSFLNQGAVHSC